MPRRLGAVSSLIAIVLALPGPHAAADQSAPGDGSQQQPDEATSGFVLERVEFGRLEPPEAVAAGVRRVFDADASPTARAAIDSLTVQSTESCYWARPTYTRYNGFGKLSSQAWYYIEWCGRDGTVTRVLTLYCGGAAAGGFTYDGCKVRKGSVGYTRVKVSGTWRFPFRIGYYTFVTRTITVSTWHYGSGRYTGTWWLYQ